MSYDKQHDDERPHGRGRHKHGHPKDGRGGHGRHSLHSGRKLSSGELQLLLLLLLKKQPSHGYELIKSLEERTDGFYAPSPGMVYPALTYLEEIGHASVETQGNKKLYQLTEDGADYLRQNRAEADEILADLERVGAQMGRARQEFEQGAQEGEIPETLEAARRDLRRAQRERAPYSPAEAERIAAILHSAAAQIKGAN